MIVLIILFYISIALWCCFLIYIYIGWRKIKPFNYEKNIQNEFVSIIVSVKNEEKYIKNLILDLNKQTYDKNFFEVIIIDDHSNDNTFKIIQDEIKILPNFKLFEMPENEKGKKKALKYGISLSNYSLIFLTDGDCRLSQEWINTYVSFYSKNNFPDVIIGLVDYMSSNRFLDKLFNIEFLSLVVSGMSLAGYGKPIYANGANIFFKKEILNNFTDDVFYEKIDYGDDTFLIHYAKRNNKIIKPLKSLMAMTYTKPPANIKEFIFQRHRWASKSFYYKDITALFTALLVLFIQVVFIFGIFKMILFNCLYYILPYILKLILENILLKKMFIFFPNKRFSALNIFMVQLIYPFYIMLIALLCFFIPVNWKKFN